jgi:replication fork clamp-binding protein CrfC
MVKKAGKGKMGSEGPIFLTIHFPKVLNLILVDLPGMVSNMDTGGDIARQIEEMSLIFIEQNLSFWQ